MKATHVPFPAPANTSKGSSAIAALGAMLATDWASTSGKDSEPCLRSGETLVSTAISLAPHGCANESPGGYPSVWWQCSEGGTSRAGLPSKKPSALSWNPTVVTGITGQSSGRTTW